MQEILVNLGSPAWWFSAIVVAFLINLGSAYAKPSVDKYGSKLSSAWRNRSEESRRQFECRVQALIESPQVLAWAFESEIRYRLNSIILFLFSTFMLLVTTSNPKLLYLVSDYSALWWVSMTFKIFALSAYVLGIWQFKSASNLAIEIRTARRALARNDGLGESAARAKQS
jgi:hypothetical protein